MTATRTRLLLGLALAAAIGGTFAAAARAADPAPLAAVRARLPQDEIIYFLLPDRFENGDPANDRGGLAGDRTVTGFDPTHKGFYHGGDLKGLTRRLDYIQSLGATAVWLAPVFANKPVQGPKGRETAGYHGYWITDFTRVDPHLGTNADFKAFVDAAHARGMKVYMDIIANHTADVIQMAECAGTDRCDYRSRADYPFQRRGGVGGTPINPGFDGADHSAANFARLTDPNYAYTVRVPDAEKAVKKPDWLNDPRYYHNRGDSTFRVESSTDGDFVGLDDLLTEHPRVIAGMIDIYGRWIDEFGVDGFRIDTEKHVNPEFWSAFIPAIQKRARARGIPNFHIFGEVFTDRVDPAYLARRTRIETMPAVLDFAFARAAIDLAAGKSPPDTMAEMFLSDPVYEGGALAALQLPTFVSNHDFGRASRFIRDSNPKADDEEMLARLELANALLLTLRGVPTIYSGDEQGFLSDGGDQDAREDMFPSRVAVYNDNRLVGTRRTTAQDNFDPGHPLYRAIANLAQIRREQPALRRGIQKMRAYDDKPGLLAISRFDPASGKEVVLLFNNSTQPVTRRIEVELSTRTLTTLAGQCSPAIAAPGSLEVSLAGLSYAVCAAQ